MLVMMGQRMVKTPSIRANLEMFVNALGYKYEPTMNAFGKDDVELTNPLPIEQVRSAQQSDNFDRVDIGVYTAKLGNQNVATIKMKDGSFEIQAA